MENDERHYEGGNCKEEIKQALESSSARFSRLTKDQRVYVSEVAERTGTPVEDVCFDFYSAR